MSHLTHVIAYRNFLTEKGIDCAFAQSEMCQEAYIRALVANHVKYQDGFSITEDEEEDLWNTLDRWNSVAPIKAKLILEAAKLRLSRYKQSLAATGALTGDDSYSQHIHFEVEEDGVPVNKKIDATTSAEFTGLFSYLCVELREKHE